MAKQEKIPGAFIRSCKGCGGKFDKRNHDFIRFANVGGKVFLDEDGNLGGRGMYICRKRECLERVRKSGRISKLLHATVSAETYELAEKKID